MVKRSDHQFIESVYQDILKFLAQKDFIKILKKELTDQDIYHIKENIYNLDFWISKKFFRSINEHKLLLKNDYSDLALMGISSTARETLFGLLIYITYIRDQSQTKDSALHNNFLIKLYVQDILHIDEYYHQKIITIINDLQADFNEIIKHRIEIDDNKEYLKIASDNRLSFTVNKGLEDIKKNIISEDVLRFK